MQSTQRDNLVLAQQMADVDGICLPIHCPGSEFRDVVTAILQRRAAYHCRGFELGRIPPNLGPAYLRLEQLGFLEIRGQRHAVRIKVTAAGDQWARGAAAAGSMADAWPRLQRLAELADGKSAQYVHGRPWVPETWLAGCAYGQAGPVDRPFVYLALRLLPALARGLVESNSTTCGRVWYSPTEAGRAALTQGCPEDAGYFDRFSPLLADAYRSRLNHVLQDRIEWSPAACLLNCKPMPDADAPAIR